MTTSLCGHCGTRNEGSPAECPACGKDPLVGGRYLLLDVLGRGGAGVSWKARRQDVGDGGGELVCLKELRWDRMGSLKDEELFHREGAILESLDHPNIPRYLDELAWPEEVGPRHALWLAQELVDGVSLEAERKTRRYTTDEVLALGESIAKTLDYLADLRPPVVHRDVKPSNIMRRKDGAIMLVDFGAARASGLVESSGTTVAGTFGFMAPEQMRGVASPATDIYGLGMTLLVLLSGREPEALLDEANTPRPERVADVSSALRTLLADMVALSPVARPSATEVARRIADLRAGRAEPVRHSVIVTPARRERPDRAPASRSKAAALLPALIATAAIGGVGIVLVNGLSASRMPPPPPLEEPVVVSSSSSVSVTTSRSTTVTIEPEVVRAAVVDPAAAAAAEREARLLSLKGDVAACPNDHAACTRLWEALRQDHDTLLQLGLVGAFEAACRNGDGQVCGLRGTMALQGDGVPKDIPAGRRFYVEGCDKGSIETCFYSGRMLVDGEGGPVDAKTGIVHLQRSCDAGNKSACMNIGVALARGQGITPERDKALRIFEEACDGGDTVACDNLAGVVGNDWGLPKDPKERFATLTRLCDKRVGTACARAGDAAASGRGTKRDATAAADFRHRACNHGVKEACR